MLSPSKNQVELRKILTDKKGKFYIKLFFYFLLFVRVVLLSFEPSLFTN